MSYAARFPGHCHGCDGPIVAGEQITTDDRGAWSHVVCPDPLAVEHAACPVCFLVHPEGACDR